MAKAKLEKPKPRPKPKPKLTDTERHKRFVDMAHAVEAAESGEAFDQAFNSVINKKKNI